ncbi:hypothetical protein [Nocardia sp. NPDC050710]|uniref:cytidylate kinase family protein n=1 Tax=Nocardia sp. NPDC050710 TaxID=3157220 RepID=UPI0033C25483
MNIAISGYTAAGKTTHARLLAKELGYEIVWASGILLERLGFDSTDESRLWFNRGAEIARRRELHKDVDIELDRYLAERVRDGVDQIFDARFLPWMSDSKCIRVWVESDLPSRARKCHASLGNESSPVQQCAISIYQKDSVDIARIARVCDSVFGPDRTLFDVIIDNSSLTATSDRTAAADGIARCHRYLSAAVASVIDGNTTVLASLEDADPTEFHDVVRYVRA